MSDLNILVVEDNDRVRKAMYTLLRKTGYATEAVSDARVAIEKLEHRFFDLVITDYKMEHMDGMELLRHIKSDRPATEVIMITAFGSIEKGVAAIKSGAFEYITKPFENEALLQVVRKFEERRSHVHDADRVASEVRKLSEFDIIIGKSNVILHIMELVSRAAKTSSTILISGESGTGKELIAQSIHALSPRKNDPFMVINCGAISENLQESELFGHARGAFTTAYSDKAGLFEVADGGTVFLDEIAETSLATQVKLLRFLEDNQVRRIGEFDRKIDVRLIAATNKDLEDEVKQGSFRSDLFYRINVIPFYLPPLRKRRDDIPLLIDHFLQKYRDNNRSCPKSISKRARSMLTNFDWPGNVRELENVIQRTMALATTDEITPDLIPPYITDNKNSAASANSNQRRLSDIEKEVILDTLERMQGNKRRTAEELGISKATLWRKLKLFASE